MKLLIAVLIIIVLGTIVCQDFKERKIYLASLIFCALLMPTLHYLNSDSSLFLPVIGLNFVFVLLLCGILWVYSQRVLKIKLTDGIGLGDLLFFFVISASFPTLSFVLFFVSSLLFSLILFKLLPKKNTPTLIPLAGLQASFFILIYLSSICAPNFKIFLI